MLVEQQINYCTIAMQFMLFSAVHNNPVVYAVTSSGPQHFPPSSDNSTSCTTYRASCTVITESWMSLSGVWYRSHREMRLVIFLLPNLSRLKLVASD